MKILSYSPAEQELVVKLADGSQYEYFDVPVELFQQLQGAPSPVAFFNLNIWGNRFEHHTHWPSLEHLLEFMVDDLMFPEPATVNMRKGDGDTPLHVACVWGDISAVEMLLTAGAQPNAFGDCGCTALYDAVSLGQVHCAKLLLAAGASADDANELGATARQRALASADVRLRELFAVNPSLAGDTD